jgi:3,4-dihydroxy 2-butanone 4-phosphate synthase / GTP cyclohydrolase II
VRAGACWWCSPSRNRTRQLLARITGEPTRPAEGDAGPAGARAGQWRRNGAGSQILADLGAGKLRVLGTPRRQIGLGGFGLEVVGYV